MHERVFRGSSLFILVFASLIALPCRATADEGPQISSQAWTAQEMSPGGTPSAALDFASLSKAACHGTVTCPLQEYQTCTNFSAYYDCGAPYCGAARECGEQICDEWGHCFFAPGPALRQRTERYRVCVNQYGQFCTEYYPGTNYVLDCGC